MGAKILYKYLDVNGGLMMLKHHNLQFTNAKKLNDPFDCHPALMDFSQVPEHKCKAFPPDIIEQVEEDPYRRTREDAWICCLSKKYDAFLMWSYYNSHKGICIGINMEKARPYLKQASGTTMIGCLELDVQYKNIVEKPDFFQHTIDPFIYQLSTKAKVWEHEHEVRLVVIEPSHLFMKCLVPKEFEGKESVDYKELRFYCSLGSECFESVYLGVYISDDDKQNIVSLAQDVNPNIMVYQMDVDTKEFKLITQRV